MKFTTPKINSSAIKAGLKSNFRLSSSHKSRIISGLIMAAVLLFCLLQGGGFLRAMLAVVAVTGLWEFYRMFWPGFSKRLLDKSVGYLVAIVLCLFSGSHFGAAGAGAVMGAIAMYAAVRFLVDYGRGATNAALPDYAIILFGVAYIPLVLQLALHISLQEQFILILASIGSDTGAYYAGCNFGKHKIWPRVSPKKSWEGSIGGMCTSMLAVSFFAAFVEIPGLEDVSIIIWAITGVLLSIAAQTGDFFESALKRVMNIKDSSNIIPGHGGVLDRTDSLLFALPVYMLMRSLMLGSL